MMKDILKKEFIGETIKVIDSLNKSEIGICGEIIDETKQTFKILSENKVRTILKRNIVFILVLEGKKYMIRGKEIIKKPEERIKS